MNREELRERKKEWMRNWRRNNPEAAKERRHKWRVDNLEKDNEHIKRYQENHKEEIRLRRKTRRELNTLKMLGLKKQRGCMECGIKDIRVLDFHHRDPKDKKYYVASIAHSSWTRMMKEIDKCDVLCANCHRMVTWSQVNGCVSSSDETERDSEEIPVSSTR